MQLIIRLLVGVFLVGFAVYALFHQYPFEYIVISLIFAGLFIMDPRWLRAKYRDFEFEARFGQNEDNKTLPQNREGAIKRLSDTVQNKDDPVISGQDKDAKQTPYQN